MFSRELCNNQKGKTKMCDITNCDGKKYKHCNPKTCRSFVPKK